MSLATARQFASNPSDPTSRWAPCPAHSDRSEHSTHRQLALDRQRALIPAVSQPAPISRSPGASLASRPRPPIFLRPARHLPFRGSIARPARTPVNASLRPRGSPTHDSGPSWIASPSTWSSFISFSGPVYPGAFSNPAVLAAWPALLLCPHLR